MKPSFRLFALFGFAAMAMTLPALAQTHPLRGPQPSGSAAAPDQPARPQTPTLVQRVRQVPVEQPTPPKPPFTLTPQEEAQVDRVLKLWEDGNKKIKTFDCKFKRWIYDFVFAPPEPNKPIAPKFIEMGVIKYAAPDKGLFRVELTEKGGKEALIEDSRAEYWISDGRSIFEYKYTATPKQLIEHKLPPELQGKAIADSPLPFLFGADAQKLKQRYFLRILAPPANVKDQICLEAYPRFQQ
jgi:TIGR03009 family protein